MLKIFRIVLFLFLGIVISCSNSDDTGDIHGDYPDADAVFLELEKIYEINQDSSISVTVSKRLLLQSFASFNRFYGETFVVYNPEFQRFTINHAFTVRPDNSEVKTPGNAFNEVLPRFAQDFAPANHLREKVITHTALEKNAIINLSYTLKSKKDFLPALMGDDAICQSSPTKLFTIKVVVPENMPLNYQLINDTVQVKKLSANGKTTYEWKFENVKAANREIAQGVVHLTEPRLIFSTATGITDLYGNITKTQNDSTELPSDLKNLIDSRLKKVKSDIEKIKIIKDIVANELITKHIPPKYLAYAYRSPSEIWKSNSASDYEKTFFLSELLSYLNMQNNVVATYPDIYDKEAANLLHIKDYYVALKGIANNDIILNASEKGMKDFSNNIANMELLSLNPIKKTAANEQQNAVAINGSIALTEKTIKGKLEGNFSGNTYNYPELLHSPNAVKNLVSNTDKSEIKQISSNTLNVVLEINKEANYVAMHNYYVWTLPKTKNGIDKYHISKLLKNRKSPFMLPFSVSESYDYTIDLPKGFAPVVEDLHLENEYPFGKLKIDFIQAENKIIVSKQLIINKTKIEVSEYSDFRKILALWNTKKYTEIVFKKENAIIK